MLKSGKNIIFSTNVININYGHHEDPILASLGDGSLTREILRFQA